MLDRVLELSRALRGAGVPVSVSSEVDALRSLREIPLHDRNAVKGALACTMIKSPAHAAAFETLFELYFGTTPRGPDPEDAPAARDRLLAELENAIVAGNAAALGGLAQTAVATFGRLERPGSPDWYSQYEVVRTLDLDGLLARLVREHAEETALSDMQKQLLRDEFERRIAEFRGALLKDTRARVARQRGPEAVARYAVAPLPEEVNFLSVSADMAELRRAIRPLTRKLATRIAMKRRRARRGAVDIRRTMRHSLSTGGVPFEAEFRHRAPHRPELFVLCDVSNSVARFSRFALMLTHALAAQFSRVRSFAFVDTIDEVTRFFAHEDFAAAVDRMNREAEVVQHDAHSDYGATFRRFLETYGRDVGPKTTLLILGDARTNYRSRHSDAVRELTQAARHSYWLNPEPIGDWDTGDSAASEYASCVDRMVEVRNLRQLQEFIATEL